MSGPAGSIEFPVGGIDDGEVRLRFRVDADVPAIIEACRDPAIQAYTRVPADYGPADAEEFGERIEREAAEGLALHLMVVDAGTNSLLGSLGTVEMSFDEGTCELGYWLAPWARGRGVMTRAIGLFCGWIFAELPMEKIMAGIEPQNSPSRALIERCGFTLDGVMRSHVVIKGTRRDLACYSLRREPAA